MSTMVFESNILVTYPPRLFQPPPFIFFYKCYHPPVSLRVDSVYSYILYQQYIQYTPISYITAI